MSVHDEVVGAFKARYGEAPAMVVRAPGRINLIGEHTDYNDGFVLPMAIDRAVWIALRPRQDNAVNAYLLDFDSDVTFSLAGFDHDNGGPGEYIKGVAWAMSDAGYVLNGWDGAVKGNVPIGAGLSSSAALELAAARAFYEVSNFRWEPATMARLGQRAENEWIGMKCGIMDQMISAGAVEGHALLIDCRSLETDPVPLPTDTVAVVLDTNTRRGLVDSAYNERREQCEAASRFFNAPALRDVSAETFEAHALEMDELLRQRARHIITENDRVLAARDALNADDAETMGILMNASHVSMRDDFEISGPELDAIVEAAQAQSSCFGARMTGGGFAGAGVALVRADAADAFSQAVAKQYKAATGHAATLYVCRPSHGAARVS